MLNFWFLTRGWPIQARFQFKLQPMKTTAVKLVCSVILISGASCKKTYQCKAQDGSDAYVFECKNCTKDDVAGYKADIESKGYTEVNCN